MTTTKLESWVDMNYKKLTDEFCQEEFNDEFWGFCKNKFKKEFPLEEENLEIKDFKVEDITYAFGEKIYFNKKNQIIKIEEDDRPSWKKVLSTILRRDIH